MHLQKSNYHNHLLVPHLDTAFPTYCVVDLHLDHHLQNDFDFGFDLDDLGLDYWFSYARQRKMNYVVCFDSDRGEEQSAGR